MASGRRGQSEINLGAGHVAGMFLAVVILCGIFFTLGYVMGRGASPAKAASAGSGASAIDSGGNPATAKKAPLSSSWDFFPKNASSSKGVAASPIAPLTPQPSASSQPVAGPISMSPKPAGVRIDRTPPLLRGGRVGYMLQVAAMENRGDALTLAGFLKQKGYPAFAWGPGPDRLYRVQVGPYGTPKQADVIRIGLEKEGFKSILKR
jgi:DedD protein